VISIGAVLDDPMCMRHVLCAVDRGVGVERASPASGREEKSAGNAEKARLHVLVVDDERTS